MIATDQERRELAAMILEKGNFPKVAKSIRAGLRATGWPEHQVDPGLLLDLLEHLAALRQDSIDASPRAREAVWRDLSSAPRDGTGILAKLPDSDMPIVIRWGDDGAGFDGWRVAWDGQFLEGEDSPTHWQPLGPLPAALSPAPAAAPTLGREALDWGQIVQCLLRIMDHAPKGQTCRDQAEEMADAILALTAPDKGGPDFVTVPVEALRNCGCPVDHRGTVGACTDAGICGCSIMLAARSVAVTDPVLTERRKKVYDKLAEEGGGTWATWMMIEIDEAYGAAPPATPKDAGR